MSTNGRQVEHQMFKTIVLHGKEQFCRFFILSLQFLAPQGRHWWENTFFSGISTPNQKKHTWPKFTDLPIHPYVQPTHIHNFDQISILTMQTVETKLTMQTMQTEMTMQTKLIMQTIKAIQTMQTLQVDPYPMKFAIIYGGKKRKRTHQNARFGGAE